jgi:hypothetical protein
MAGPIPRDRRGISKEGMAALGFALTVAMMGVTGGILMQTSDDLSSGGPIVSAEAESIDASNSLDSQWVRIRHETGDSLDVANLTINVSIPAHRVRARLTGIPTDGIRQSDYTGNHVFTIGPPGVDGALRANDTDGRWTSGEVLAFRIEPRRVDLRPDQTVTVTIRHEPEDKRLYRETIDVV